MKTIGDVAAKFDDEGKATNADYLGGCIVMLTRREADILYKLQEAAKGDQWHFSSSDVHVRPDDIIMDNLFWLVLQFAEAKFSVNEFKKAIETLDALLMKPAAGE